MCLAWKWILKIATGLTLFASCACQRKPEWMKNNAPEWSLLYHSENGQEWYINTRIIAVARNGWVLSITKGGVSPDKQNRFGGRSYAIHDVWAFDCKGMALAQDVADVDVDTRREPLREATTSGNSIEPVPDNTPIQAQQLATCWMAAHGAQPTWIPAYYNPALRWRQPSFFSPGEEVQLDSESPETSKLRLSFSDAFQRPSKPNKVDQLGVLWEQNSRKWVLSAADHIYEGVAATASEAVESAKRALAERNNR